MLAEGVITPSPCGLDLRDTLRLSIIIQTRRLSRYVTANLYELIRNSSSATDHSRRGQLASNDVFIANEITFLRLPICQHKTNFSEWQKATWRMQHTRRTTESDRVGLSRNRARLQHRYSMLWTSQDICGLITQHGVIGKTGCFSSIFHFLDHRLGNSTILGIPVMLVHDAGFAVPSLRTQHAWLMSHV